MVVLKLTELDGVELYPLDLSLADADILVFPAMTVSIIGYPFGLSVGGGWPVWKTGHIASEPQIDFNNSPGFLVDVTGRGGMSGSPVVVRPQGQYQSRSGGLVIGSSPTLFLGIYSAQFDAAELGMVWQPSVIKDILQL